MCARVFLCLQKVYKMNTILVLLILFLKDGLTFSVFYETEKNTTDDHMLNASKRLASTNRLSDLTQLPKKFFKSSLSSNMASETDSFETLLNRCKKLVPNLSNDKHKGQSGRIGVFGGSKDYTGAPYFASMSALRTGADLVYVFCAEAAAQPIKSYSPELMVVPYLDVNMPAEEIQMWIKRLHVAVIGPGLGRNTKILEKIRETIGYLKDVKIPLVIDADGLFFISQNPKILKDYEGPVYLTPNINEYKLLATDVLNPSSVDVDDKTLKELSKQIGNNITIVLKAREDRIVNGDKVLVYPVEGSPRRCGGQGDMLSGCLAAFSGWAQNCKEDKVEAQMFAAFAASTLVKTCSKLTFKEKGRGMIVSDMLAKLHIAFDTVYEDHKHEKGESESVADSNVYEQMIYKWYKSFQGSCEFGEGHNMRFKNVIKMKIMM